MGGGRMKQPTTQPQLAQPRTFLFAADELCARLLGIPPVGEYDAWADWQREPEPGALTMERAESIAAIGRDVLEACAAEGAKAAQGMKAK